MQQQPTNAPPLLVPSSPQRPKARCSRTKAGVPLARLGIALNAQNAQSKRRKPTHALALRSNPSNTPPPLRTPLRVAVSSPLAPRVRACSLRRWRSVATGCAKAASLTHLTANVAGIGVPGGVAPKLVVELHGCAPAAIRAARSPALRALCRRGGREVCLERSAAGTKAQTGFAFLAPPGALAPFCARSRALRQAPRRGERPLAARWRAGARAARAVSRSADAPRSGTGGARRAPGASPSASIVSIVAIVRSGLPAALARARIPAGLAPARGAPWTPSPFSAS